MIVFKYDCYSNGIAHSTFVSLPLEPRYLEGFERCAKLPDLGVNTVSWHFAWRDNSCHFHTLLEVWTRFMTPYFSFKSFATNFDSSKSSQVLAPQNDRAARRMQ